MKASPCFLAAFVFWIGAMAACAAQPPKEAASPSDAFQRALSACSERTGYFPKDSESLPPNQLGRNERAWAQCVYAGIEEHVLPISAAPDLYRRLVARHRELTDAIEANRATRAERLRELTPLLDEIRDADNAALAKREKEISALKDHHEQQRMMEDMDRVQRGAVRAQRAVRVGIR